MRIAKLVVAAIFTLATGLAVQAQDDFDLDALLDDIQQESASAGEDIPDFDEPAEAMETPMKGAEDLLDDLAASVEDVADPAAESASDAVDTDILDMLETEPAADGVDDLLDSMAEGMDDSAAVAEETVEDMANDLESLFADDLGEETEDAVADMAGQAAPEAASSMDSQLGAMNENVEAAIDEIVPMHAQPSGIEAPAEIEAATEPDTFADLTMDSEAAPAPVSADTAAAEELSAAEMVRLRAQELDGREQMEKGFDALSDDRFGDAVAHFDAAMKMIPMRKVNEADLESVRWGLAEANTRLGEELLKAGDAVQANEAVVAALSLVPNHRGAIRLQKKTEKELAKGPPYTPVRERQEVVNLNRDIEQLLREGRDYYKNKIYDQAETLFEQVRYLDEYNVEAMEYLKKIEDRRFELSTIERDRTVASMLEQVRQSWNPPIRRDIKPPEAIDDPDAIPTDEDEGREELMKKMSQLIIPSIQFRDANIQDVIEELRIQSEKNDPEGLGVNIVLKLQSNAPATTGIVAPGGDQSFFNDGFGEGRGREPIGGAGDGFGDAFGGGFNDPGFDDGFGNDFGGGFADETFNDVGALDTPTGPTVTPPVTLTLRRISLLEALKIITEYADLKFKIENRIVFITPSSTLTDPLETRVYSVQPSLLRVIISTSGSDQQQERRGGGGGGEFIELGTQKQVERVDARTFFSNAGVPFPPGTSIFYNEQISQLVVRNTIENLEIFERLLPKFNVPPPQVEIEARFVEILNDDLQELGLEWILTDNYEIASNTSQGGLANRERLQIDANENGITSGLRYLSSGPTGIEAATRAGGGSSFTGSMLSFSSVLTNPEINVVLHAIEQKGGSDLLSAPRIVTRSGVNASIEVVQEIIYPTEFEAESASSRIDSSNSGDVNVENGIVIFPENFETREVGVILNVTPTVGPDNYTIDLTLSPEVAELVDWIQYGTPPFNIPQPIFASRNATTSIVIWDGQTVAMGGLINEELLSFEDKVPFLGDIPLIGHLFRSRGERSVKRNLLIFVSARIVDPAGRPVNQIQATADAVVTEDPLMP